MEEIHVKLYSGDCVKWPSFGSKSLDAWNWPTFHIWVTL